MYNYGIARGFKFSKLKKSWLVIKTFLQNTTFQGYHYLVDPGLHWSERVFWFICIAVVSSCGIVLMLRTSLEFRTKPINLTVDTNYLNWITQYPAIMVCEKELSDDNKLAKHFPKQFIEKGPDKVDFGQFLERANQLIYFRGSVDLLTDCLRTEYLAKKPANEYLVQTWKEHTTYCRLLNDKLQQLQNVRSNCTDLFWKCYWDDVEFNCCEKFLPMKTPYGVCFAINSMIALNSSKPEYTATANDASLLKLYFLVESVKYDVYVISREENIYPRDGMKKQIFFEAKLSYKTANLYVKIRPTANDKGVRNIPLDIRQCRFPDENNLISSLFYSFPSCMIEQLAAIQVKYCKCMTYLQPELANKSLFCDEFSQMNCIANITDQMYAEVDRKKCMISCVETEVIYVGFHTMQFAEYEDLAIQYEYKSMLKIHFSPIRMRYHRKIVRDTDDLIVNIGGIGTLFFGASVISVVEIFYYFFIYPIIYRTRTPTFDKSALSMLKPREKKEVFSYVDFKEKIMLSKQKKAMYPFRN